jgi:5-methylcytosine-specific restriction protein A
MRLPPRLKTSKPKVTPRIVFKDHDARRGTAHQRGYGVNWRKLREVVLNAEPVCRHCAERGRAVPAVEVDHIQPLRDGGDNSRENLQPLCCACHDAKTMRDLVKRRHRA